MGNSPTRVNPDPRRSLPSVSKLAGQVAAGRPDLPAWAVTEASRQLIEEVRSKFEGDPSGGSALEPGDWTAQAAGAAAALCRAHPRPVINATGVVLHTNLGRSPIAAGAADAARLAAAGYTDLELDLETGRRGSRLGSLEVKLCALSGAEAAYACNNNAAAVMLAVDTFARRRTQGKEVVVSRGELVEIGGSFRVPDIMASSGAKLLEVGTTNRTHPHDYERAIGAETALLLKVHRSNFHQQGFVKEVELGDLVGIGGRHGVPVMEDLGSGTLVDLTGQGFPAESFAPSRVAAGADVVCFSGDKLLGGPQAGILLGKRDAIDAVRSNPLARALRLDKMSLAALDWTLDAYLGGRAEDELPVLRQMLEPADRIEARARALADRLRDVLKDRFQISVESDRAPVGGGSLPGFELDTWVVVLRGGSASKAAAALRDAASPVLTRIRDDAVLLDLRTVEEGELPAVIAGASEGLV